MEKAAYVILILLGACWLFAIFAGMIVAFPVGLVGLLVLLAFGLLFIKVLKDRLSNKEDDHYSKEVQK